MSHLLASFDWVAALAGATASALSYAVMKIDPPFPPSVVEAPLPNVPNVGLMQHGADNHFGVHFKALKEYNGKPYGVRIAHVLQHICTSNVADINHVLVENPNGMFPKGPDFKILSKLLGDSIICEADQAVHAQQRKALNPAFSRNALHRIGNTTIIDETLALCSELRRMLEARENKDEQHVDAVLQQVFIKTTFNVIAEAAFRIPRDQCEQVYTDIQALQHFLPFLASPLLTALPTQAQRDFRAGKKRINETCLGMISEARKQFDGMTAEERQHFLESGQGKALLDYLVLNASDIMSSQKLVDNAFTFIFAGHDTTAQTLIWIVAFLAANPSVQEKLFEEVQGTMPLGEGIAREQELHSCSYLQDVIKESMRLWPSAAFILRVASEDTVLPGTKTFIPKGWTIACKTINTMRDPLVWGDDADTFRPERWEEGADEMVERLGPGVYAPFGCGKMQCIGREFAISELKILLAALVRKFKFELPPGQSFPQATQVISVCADPHQIRFWLREE